jgi:Tol biopolymer transport system component
MSERGLSRRELLVRTGAVAAGLSVPVVGIAAAEPQADVAGDAAGVELTEGTNMSAALSPDGRRLAIDLVAAIWVLPASGGQARRLTGDLADATLPSWSPDGRQIAFQSYQDGNFQLYIIDATGGASRKVTSGEFDSREPVFSPDGRRLAFSSDRDGSYSVWSLDLASGAITAITSSPDEEAAPSWSPDGERIVFTVNDTAIDVLTLATGERQRVVTAAGQEKFYGPAFGPDGRISYLRLLGADADLMLGDKQITHGEDVFGFAASWFGQDVVYTADGGILRREPSGAVQRIPFRANVSVARREYRHRVRELDSTAPKAVRGIAGPVVSKDGRRIAFRALGALYTVPFGGGTPTRLTTDEYFASDPDFSPDGKTLLYSSDRLGTADLWLRDLGTGQDTVLTSLAGAQITPRWSPDGGHIAYTDHNGAVWTLDVATKKVQQVTPALSPRRVPPATRSTRCWRPVKRWSPETGSDHGISARARQSTALVSTTTSCARPARKRSSTSNSPGLSSSSTT